MIFRASLKSEWLIFECFSLAEDGLFTINTISLMNGRCLSNQAKKLFYQIANQIIKRILLSFSTFFLNTLEATRNKVSILSH